MLSRRSGIALAIASLLLLPGVESFAAGQGSDNMQSASGRSEENSDTTSNERSKVDKESETRTDDKGGGRTTTKDQGSRSSVSREVSRALEKMRNRSLQRSLNVVGIYAKASQDAGLIKKHRINDFLYQPVGRDQSYRRYLESVADQNGDASKFVKLAPLRAYMSDLYRAGEWISQNLVNARMADGMGRKDWEYIASVSAAYGREAFNALQINPDLNGDCYFTKRYDQITCGSCVLDLSLEKGLPVLTCSGLAMFGPDSAGGETIVVQASESASMRDAETIANRDETFSGITKTVDDYVKWAATHSKGVEASVVKKRVLSDATKDTRNTTVPLQAMKQQEDPSKVMGMIGIR